MAADPTSTATGLIAVLLSAGLGVWQVLQRSADEKARQERAQQAEREKAERERQEKEADEDRARVSDRLRRLEEKVALHDIADARHDQALSHVASLLEEIRTDMRDVRAAVLERPRSSGGR